MLYTVQSNSSLFCVLNQLSSIHHTSSPSNQSTHSSIIISIRLQIGLPMFLNLCSQMYKNLSHKTRDII